MNLNDEFEQVRNAYFPRWDKTRQWKIEFGTVSQLRGNSGYCELSEKTIYINRRTFLGITPSGRAALIAHEICHDLGAAFHNRRWADRVRVVMQQAVENGDNEMADILDGDILSFCQPGVQHRYDWETVSKCLSMFSQEHPFASREQVLRMVSRYFGVRSDKLKADFRDVNG